MIVSDYWLYDKHIRVPPITDEQIAEMRRIEPVLRDVGMFRRIKDIGQVHPRKDSFLWNAEPCGGKFTFHVLNQATIITQHYSCIWFKPSLAEVYAWMRVLMPDTWHLFDFFCLEDPKRIGGGTDCTATCTVLGGTRLVAGKTKGGMTELVPAPDDE